MKKSKYKPFYEAKAYAQSLGVKSYKEWWIWSRNGSRPKDIPSQPSKVYAAEGWKDWGDFLSTGVIANKRRTYMPYIEAKKYAQSLGLKTLREWRHWSKNDDRPENMPSNPHVAYSGNGWNGWKDFLGTSGSPRRKIRNQKSFEDTKKYVQTLGLKSWKEWCCWVRSDARPQDIAIHPAQAYKNSGWNGWDDFLGTDVSLVQ